MGNRWAADPARKAHNASHPLAGGAGCPSPRIPVPLSAIRASNCSQSGLIEPVSRNEEIKIWPPYYYCYV